MSDVLQLPYDIELPKRYNRGIRALNVMLQLVGDPATATEEQKKLIIDFAIQHGCQEWKRLANYLHPGGNLYPEA